MVKSVFEWVSFDLQTIRKESVPFPFADAGFLYGYGCFETIRIQNGKAPLLQEHIRRLRVTALILDLPFRWQSKNIQAAVADLIQHNKAANAVLNIYLTGGERDMLTKGEPEPQLLMVLRHMTPTATNGFRLTTREVSFQRIKADQFKLMAYAKNIWEKRLAHPFDDVLLYDHRQIILETTSANFFLLEGDTLITPKAESIVNGVMRQFVISHAPSLGLKVRQETVPMERLGDADEVFLTNAIHGIIPILEVEKFNDLKSGPMTQKIKTQIEQRIGLQTL
jgi:branched-subunit amino acid aminotransferase/4-amino-4-deoxychorismate lyase